MKKRALVVWIFAVVTMALLAGCGGGGGGGTTGSNNSTSNNSTDTVAPTVISTNPAANSATAVAVNTAITATFSEAMDCSTITTSSFTLKDNLNTAVAGTITTCNNTTAVFTPSSNLSYTTLYTAAITTGVKDAAGNAMASNYSWQFTSGSALYQMGGSMQGNPLNLTNTVTTFAGAAGVIGSIDGTGTWASFASPNGITTDGANLYVADASNNKVRKVVISTGAVTTIAGSGSTGSTDGTGLVGIRGSNLYY